MKLVTAIIQPPKLEAVLTALCRVEIQRLTVCDAQGYDPLDTSHTDQLSGAPGDRRLSRKLNLELVVNDDFLQLAIDAIKGAAITGSGGEIGDGKLFVFPVDDVVNTTGERGPQAV